VVFPFTVIPTTAAPNHKTNAPDHKTPASQSANFLSI
jgi:hypothetical protein